MWNADTELSRQRELAEAYDDTLLINRLMELVNGKFNERL
jgi:hypothetical protein